MTQVHRLEEQVQPIITVKELFIIGPELTVAFLCIVISIERPSFFEHTISGSFLIMSITSVNFFVLKKSVCEFVINKFQIFYLILFSAV